MCGVSSGSWASLPSLLMWVKHLNFAMVHQFPRHGKVKKLLLFKKPKSRVIFLNFVCYWMGFMFAEVLWCSRQMDPTAVQSAVVLLQWQDVKAEDALVTNFPPNLKCVSKLIRSAPLLFRRSGPCEAVDYSSKCVPLNGISLLQYTLSLSQPHFGICHKPRALMKNHLQDK